MRDTALKRKKAEALYYVYRQGLEEGRFSSFLQAGSYCALQPAPCFFISAKRASLIIGRIAANESLIFLNSSQRRMAWQLWRNYNRYLLEHPDNTLSRERILEILVDEPAPEFYISGDGARKIIRDEIKKKRRAYGWGE